MLWVVGISFFSPSFTMTRLATNTISTRPKRKSQFPASSCRSFFFSLVLMAFHLSAIELRADAPSFHEGLCSFHTEDEKYGFFDLDGKTVIPPQFESTSRLGFSEGLCAATREGKWGYIGKDGAWRIPAQFKYAMPVTDGVAEVTLDDGSKAWFDTEGKPIARPTGGALAPSRKDGKWGFVDRGGVEILPYAWTRAWPFSEGLAAVQSPEGMWGFIDKSGKLAIPAQWKDAENFAEGLAVVQSADDKWGFIDKTGKLVISAQWSTAYGFTEGLAAVKSSENKWGFIDKSGKLVIPAIWDMAGSFSEGRASVAMGNNPHESGGMGCIDKTGKLVIPLKPRGIGKFTEGRAPVYFRTNDGATYSKDGNKMYVYYIDVTGKMRTPSTFHTK